MLGTGGTSGGPPNKPLEQANGALARMEAPFAAQRQRWGDTGAMRAPSRQRTTDKLPGVLGAQRCGESPVALCGAVIAYASKRTSQVINACTNKQGSRPAALRHMSTGAAMGRTTPAGSGRNPQEKRPNKQLELTKSVPAVGTTAFAAQLRRSPDLTHAPCS